MSELCLIKKKGSLYLVMVCVDIYPFDLQEYGRERTDCFIQEKERREGAQCDRKECRLY